MNATTPDPDEYLLGDLPRPKPRRQTTVKRAERATRKQEALRMRVAGVTPDAIAAAMKVHPSTVYAWIRDALAAVPREEAEELRLLELDRLDALMRAVWADAMAGDTKAIDAVLRIMARRASLLNLDAAPTAGLEAVGTLLDRLVGGEG
ncbi:helix-turn-helix domain-containing protein [Agromyces indicus]|uniref:Helix-turn-helix domain-containing protein n=1 Tax=Agromyces indicus TaxID=758919 RepID=A0ABU1FK17_9MICO|nr:helix-turn-helix domain-containing protein [Agromyces indicus]MDR5692099.1 helix-turn-helix domain-containing protein [Agromyces indicus]